MRVKKVPQQGCPFLAWKGMQQTVMAVASQCSFLNAYTTLHSDEKGVATPF